jgi:hypothetical protein
MDNLQHTKEYGTGFIEYYLYPLTITHILFFLIYTIISSYIYRYLFSYPLFKWMYLGLLVIFIALIYGDKNDSSFKRVPS